jgi:hypothetical protein
MPLLRGITLIIWTYLQGFMEKLKWKEIEEIETKKEV